MSPRRSLVSIALMGALVFTSFAQSGCAGRRARRAANANLQIARHSSAQMGCPEAALSVSQLGGGQYQVQGCGRMATFVCAAGGRRGGWGWRGGYRSGGCQMVSPPVAVAAAPPPQAQPQYGVTAQAQVGGVQAQATYQGPQAAPQPGYQAAPPPPAAAPAPAPAATASAQAWSEAIGMALFTQLQGPVLACVPGSSPLVLNLEIQLDGRIANVSGVETLPQAQQSCVTTVVSQAAVPGGLSQAVRVPFTFR